MSEEQSSLPPRRWMALSDGFVEGETVSALSDSEEEREEGEEREREEEERDGGSASSSMSEETLVTSRTDGGSEGER